MRTWIIFALLVITVTVGGCQNSPFPPRDEKVGRSEPLLITPPQAEPQINGPRGKLPPKGD